MFSVLDVNDMFGARLTVQKNTNPRPALIPKINPPNLIIDLGNTKVFTPYEYDHIGFATVDNNDIYSKNTLDQFEYREKAMLVREPRTSCINNILYQMDPNNWL
jgi:hypothetical protein